MSISFTVKSSETYSSPLLRIIKSKYVKNANVSFDSHYNKYNQLMTDVKRSIIELISHFHSSAFDFWNKYFKASIRTFFYINYVTVLLFISQLRKRTSYKKGRIYRLYSTVNCKMLWLLSVSSWENISICTLFHTIRTKNVRKKCYSLTVLIINLPIFYPSLKEFIN